MDTAAALDPSDSQILVNLGSRYVVFGPPTALPQPLRFDPLATLETEPRAEAKEVNEQRVIETLRVHGFEKRRNIHDLTIADFELLDEEGHTVFVDLKIRHHDPKKRDFEQSADRIKLARRHARNLQIWYINVDHLKLFVISYGRGIQIKELQPLDVWERTSVGVFDRAKAIEEVRDWEKRLGSLYGTIDGWVHGQAGLRSDRSRKILMSEELMQNFAVADRELPVLDILKGDQVIMSFIPRGLWIIGAWGRVDLITSDKTSVIVAVRGDDGKFEWRLASRTNRQTEPFDEKAFLALVPCP